MAEYDLVIRKVSNFLSLGTIASAEEFSHTDFTNAVHDYRESWKFADDLLRSICMRYPEHTHEKIVNAKILILGRAYSTGIERSVGDRADGQSAIEAIARHVFGKGAELDELIRALPTNTQAPAAPAKNQPTPALLSPIFDISSAR